MRNLILLFAILLSAQFASQTITAWSPTVICPGDTICVTIYNPEKKPFFFNIQTKWELHWYEVWTDSIKKDTTKYCFETPIDLNEQWLGDTAHLGINLETFANLVVLLYCPPNKVGIEEYFQNKSESFYYDMQGNRVAKRPNELMIEQNGLYRRKAYMLE